MANFRNAEFKASVKDIDLLEDKLNSLSPRFVGEDHQTDIYFNVSSGRLKLREGNIENALIWYRRTDIAGIKQSDIILYEHTADRNLRLVLESAIGIKHIVEKVRRIYFIGNIKFHFDRVKGLGNFIEVEAIDESGTFDQQSLVEQCRKYCSFFNIQPDDFIDLSYAEMPVM